MKVTPAMIGRQVRYAGRSIRDLARQPGRGRELPRLLATRGRSTTELRLPWLPFRLIDELERVCAPGARVFEYGGGGSTLWFLDRGASVVTVEHEEQWARILAGSVEDDRWTLLRHGSEHGYAEYVSAIQDYPDAHFDVVVVDGRERARCLVAAQAKVRPGGLLIMDDTDRPRYAAALDAVGWPRRDVVGFAPAKPTLAYTTVLTRPEA